MKKVVIFGTEQFSEILYFFLETEKEYKVCAFTVDSSFKKTDYFCGLPVIEFEKIENRYSPKEYDIFICLGYTKMNTIREQKFLQAKEKGYKILSYQHKSALVLSKDFGEGNIIMENVTIGAFCKIGDGNVFWARSHVAHHTCVEDFNFFTINSAVAGNIHIHKHCFFGNNCTIKNGIDIADYTLVGAGCYISKSTERNGVYVPNRSIKLDKDSMDMKL